MTSILKADNIQDADGNNIINESGNTITIGASGDTTNIIGTLQNDGAAVANTPAFEAYLSANQTGISANSATKVQFDTEVYDTDSAYDNSTNYRFTPQVAGKYFVYAGIAGDANASSNLTHMNMYIYKNGSLYRYIEQDFRNNQGFRFTAQGNATIDMNGTSDYIEIYGVIDFLSGTADFNENTKNTYFGAYKIIGA